MKVLWLTNEPLPELADALGKPQKPGRSWITTLSQALIEDGRIELGIASRFHSNENVNISLGSIRYFTIQPRNKADGLFPPDAKMLQRYQEIIDQFSPDVIHVHGTEWNGGFITKDNRINTPSVISLQGLINFHQRFLLGGLGFLDILKSRTFRDWIQFRGLWELRLQWSMRAVIEREIIEGHNCFVGRTLWDRAHLRQMNTEAHYFHCDEIVQTEFFDNKWDISKISRHTIFAPSASYPLKGFHTLLRAVEILKKEFPDIRVRVPLANFSIQSGLKGWINRNIGYGYSNYLSGLIRKYDLCKNVISLGNLTSSGMAEEMKNTNVFALSSFVENSPNSLAEALTVGIPSVVSLVGGIPGLISEGIDALGFPVGDEAVLAEQIRRIFLDDNLAIKLSLAGQKTALRRYSVESIVKRMIDIYTCVIMDEYSELLERSPYEA